MTKKTLKENIKLMEEITEHGVIKLLPSEICEKYNIQNCGFCDRTDCCDNLILNLCLEGAEKLMTKKDLQYYKALEYEITVEEVTKEMGGGYEAYVEELGRWTCTAAGETEVEAIKNLKKHKDWLIEDWYKRGETIPEPKND